MLNKETMDRLIQTAEPAISIYVAIDPAQRDTRAPDAGLRDLITEADAMLQRDGTDKRRIEQLLAPVHEIERTTDFARHRDPALAIFTCDGFTVVRSLPRPVPSAAVIGTNFHIKPLLPFLAANKHFFVLALSKAKVRLLAATPFSCAEVPLDTLPADAQAELDSEAEAGGDEASDSERQALLTESPKRIATAVQSALGDDPAPLVLVADPRVAGHFVEQANIPNILPDIVTVNPFSMPERDLLSKAMETITPLLSRDLDAALDQINARLGTAEPTVAIKLEEILHAAREGRVDTLVVAEDQTLWGNFSPDHVLTAHGHRAPHDEDLLNLAVVSTLRTGGRAFAAPHERLPRQTEASALLRF